MTRHTTLPTPVGDLAVAEDAGALTAIWFVDEGRPLPDGFGLRVEPGGSELLGAAVAQLTDYLTGARREFDLPLRTSGNAFQESVWALLRELPFGATTTYGALGAALGDRALAQQVGQAVGHNPLAVVVPCHRVIGADGSLTGYAGGLHRKRFLLALEERDAASAGRLF